MITLCGRAQNVNNEAFLWKTAVLGREKPTVGAGTSCPWPILVFYIPPCRKTFTAWRNVKCQHGRATKCSRTNRGLYHSQNCNFPEERFILISFCHSAGLEKSGTRTGLWEVMPGYWQGWQNQEQGRDCLK